MAREVGSHEFGRCFYCLKKRHLGNIAKLILSVTHAVKTTIVPYVNVKVNLVSIYLIAIILRIV